MTMARLLIGGTGSGCGKTTVTNALFRALQRRGIPLAGFKCGPDYIDPMFHRAVLDVPSRNLDLFFLDEADVRAELNAHIPADGLGIIEGVMGFYDGISVNTDEASSAHLARVTDSPAILVVRPKGQALSLAAILQGFRDFLPNTISGVVLNGVTKGMYPFYRNIVEKTGLHVYGYLPTVPAAGIPERHLGLVTAGEIEGLRRKMDMLADAAEEGLELDGLITLARTALPLPEKKQPLKKLAKVRIGVAMDKAFCFYYEDNLDVLRELGAELVTFSPLEDRHIPGAVDGLYIGGGYPELYAARLAENEEMRGSIYKAVQDGLPAIAECGGFQYLHRTLDGYPMAGVLPAVARMTDKLQHFGYVTLTARRDNLLCRKGGCIRAHEFHYGTSDNMGDAFQARKPSGRSWLGVYATDTLYAGYPHIYFRSNPDFARAYIRKCAEKHYRRQIK